MKRLCKIYQQENRFPRRFSFEIISTFLAPGPPRFTVKPVDTEVLDGNTASLECRAEGYPIPAIAWTKDGGRLPSQDRHVVLPSGTLRVIYARPSDQGQYECQAINIVGVRLIRALLTVSPRGKLNNVLWGPWVTHKWMGSEHLMTWLVVHLWRSENKMNVMNTHTGTLHLRFDALQDAVVVDDLFFHCSCPLDRWETNWHHYSRWTDGSDPVPSSRSPSARDHVDQRQCAHHRGQPLLRQFIRVTYHPGYWKSRRREVRVCGTKQHWCSFHSDDTDSTGWGVKTEMMSH